jgi:hypothetical protein
MASDSTHDPCILQRALVQQAALKRDAAREQYQKQISLPDLEPGAESAIIDAAAASRARGALEAAEDELARAQQTLRDCQQIHGVG